MLKTFLFDQVPPCIMCLQYRGGYHEYCGGYHEYCGGYLEYRGGVQCSNNKRFFPTILNTPTVLMISPHVHHDIPTVLMISPTVLNIPTVLKIFPTVLNIPHGTQDIPHMHYDIPHGTEHPHGTPHIIQGEYWSSHTALFRAVLSVV